MYADETFYKEVYFGKVIPDADLDSFLSRASDAVDQLTFFNIPKKGGIDELTSFQQRQVRIAVCEQADFMYGVQEMPTWVQSYSVGSVSVSRKNDASARYSQNAIAYLRVTNLMYGGLG